MIKEKSAPDVLDEKQATWADCTEHNQNQTGLNHSQRLRQDFASWISPLVIEPSKSCMYQQVGKIVSPPALVSKVHVRLGRDRTTAFVNQADIGRGLDVGTLVSYRVANGASRHTNGLDVNRRATELPRGMIKEAG